MTQFGTSMKRSFLFKIFANFPEVVLVSLVSASVILCNTEVLFRYFLNIQVAGLDELLKMMLVWISFLGAAVGVKNAGHFGFHTVSSRLPQKIRTLLSYIEELAILIVGLTMMTQGVKATKVAFRQTFTALPFSYGWEYIVFPLCGAIMSIYAIWTGIAKFKKK